MLIKQTPIILTGILCVPIVLIIKERLPGPGHQSSSRIHLSYFATSRFRGLGPFCDIVFWSLIQIA